MNQLQPADNNVILPAILPQNFFDIDSLTTALGIPRNVLALDEEIAYAWRDLPRELQEIPPKLRAELGELIARTCVAVRAGLFDSGINYIWNATVLRLKQCMKDFGLPVVSQILQRKFEEGDLLELQDSETIELCLKLSLITEDGYFFLDQCRATRNNFSAAHPTIGKINDREFITFLNRCVRYALLDQPSLVGVDFSSFISAVKGQRFAEGQCDIWLARVEATHEAQRQLLFGTLHGIYCDPASPETARLNSIDLCGAYSTKFTNATKSDLIDQHSDYLAKGDTQRHNASLQFFEKLGLLSLLNEAERHSVLSRAVQQLLIVHLGFNNFYNEPPFAERLMTLSQLEAIPETIQEQFVETVNSSRVLYR